MKAKPYIRDIAYIWDIPYIRDIPYTVYRDILYIRLPWFGQPTSNSSCAKTTRSWWLCFHTVTRQNKYLVNSLVFFREGRSEGFSFCFRSGLVTF